MIRAEHSGVIPQPLDVVFPVISDPQTQLVWDAATLRSVTKLDDGELARGSRYRGTFQGVRDRGVRVRRLPAELALRPPGEDTGRHDASHDHARARGQSTRVVQTGELEPNLMGRILGGLVRRNLRKRFATIVDEVSSFLAER
jgi:hypothetical protein